jgi:uncharacterized protein
MFYFRSAIYFCCAGGGRARAGQLWRLDPRGQELTLMAEPDSRAVLDAPDQVCAAPNGDVMMCEEGQDDNFIVGFTRDARFYRMARSAAGPSALAGACFSPDGQFLFVNLEEPGITFVISGPWERRG